ncbi:TIM23 complex component [Pseudocyphellaria aurata]|nr:TIM23 complex component [Pseudocyphellaria aurata]
MLSNPTLHLRSTLASLKSSHSHFGPCCIVNSSHPPRPGFQSNPNRPSSSSSTQHRPTLTKVPPTTFQRHLVRSASASTASSPAVTTPPITTLPPRPTAQVGTSEPDPSALSWNRYLQLRRTRRHYNLVASLGTSICTTAVGISILSRQNIETLGGGVFGLDPFIVLGLATAASGAVGWLIGPFVGNAVFTIIHRKFRNQITIKDKDFYRRIKQHRVDPSSQSYSNPVPDYYGEKIGSVAEFRNWMKDQRAYNKKRQNFL